MNNLQIISTETLNKLTTKRAGETKFFEQAKYLSNTSELSSELARTEVKFVLFGIKEDIGVLANTGQAGAKNTWDVMLKALLNLQSNQFTTPENTLVLGHLEFSDLYARLSELKTEKSLQTYRKSVEIIDQSVSQLVYEIVKAGKIPILIGGGHNNAYGAIKGSASALGTKINALNFDAHSDLRALEGRHSGNGFRYAMGSAILDEEAPDQVKYRTQPYLLGPAEPYEMVGDVPNVVFPCAALHDIEEDKLAIYYGAADTVVALAFGKLSEVVQYTKENSL